MKKVFSGSVFNLRIFTRCNTDQLVDKFNNAVEKYNQSKLAGISSHSPSVNLEFLSVINEQRDERGHLPHWY